MYRHQAESGDSTESDWRGILWHMWQRVLIVAGAEAIIVGVPAMMGAEFLSANAHWVTALGAVALIMGAFWHTITNPIRSVAHRLMSAKSTHDRERDVIPLEFRVWGTRTKDGVDIEPQIVYRNRAPIDLRIKPTSATYILDNKKPEGPASRGFSGELKKESNSSVSFKPIRVYDTKNKPSGMAAIEFFYGPKEGGIDTKLGISYIFKVLSMPTDSGRKEKLDFEAVQNFNYEDI